MESSCDNTAGGAPLATATVPVARNLPPDTLPESAAARAVRLLRPPAWCTVLLVAGAWLIAITLLHAYLNRRTDPREVVSMGYMPVITNLACPLLAEATRHAGPVRFEALKFSSFAEMAEALRGGHIDAAFLIAPLAIVLHQQGEDVRIVYVGNRHESDLVVRKDLGARSFGDLAGRTIAVPMRYSGHNLAVRMLAEQSGMGEGGVEIVEMNPPDMAAALTAESLDAYFVGEPFAAQTVRSGDAEVLYHVEDVWPGFICNVLVVRAEFIASHGERVQALVRGSIRAGVWAQAHLEGAAEVAAAYWNQPVDLVSYALSTPNGRIVFDRFTPHDDEIQHLADEMVRFGLSDSADIAGLVDSSFARAADLHGVDDLADIASSGSQPRGQQRGRPGRP